MGWANELHRGITEFGEDPHGPGRSLVRAIWERVQGLRTHPYAPEKSDPSITFNGYAESPQDFKGFSLLHASNTVPYRNGGFANISSGLVEGPMGDPARRIFAQRLARRGASGGSS